MELIWEICTYIFVLYLGIEIGGHMQDQARKGLQVLLGLLILIAFLISVGFYLSSTGILQ